MATIGELGAGTLGQFVPNSAIGSNVANGGIASTRTLPDGFTTSANPTVTVRPWRIATYGDSRVNTSSTAPDVASFQLVTNVRVPAWVAAYLGDAEITRNYGVSGDAAVNWSSTSRSGGKTFSDMDTSDVDAVLIQYGINDCMALTPAATIVTALKALISECFRAGKLVIFESINPIRSPATSPAQAQAIADSVNASMQQWISLFQNQAVFCNTAPLLKSPDGYANPRYYNADGIHFVTPGAQFAAKLIAQEARKMLPRRAFTFLSPDTLSPNLLDLFSPSVFSAVEVGTASTVVTSSGQDINGFYTDYTYTPLTLSSGECRLRLELSVNFQTSTQPAYALIGNEVLQGSARIICDDGQGGAPNAYSVCLRHRFYTGSVFRDWGVIPPGGTFADLTEKFDLQLITPRVANATASVVANPSSGAGYQLQAIVSSQVVNKPVRVRIYNGQCRRVAYTGVPLAVTVPASTVPYTNTTQGTQEIIVSGGTISVIAINGVTTGLTSGTFSIDPTETLTMTYTVAPTIFLAKQF